MGNVLALKNENPSKSYSCGVSICYLTFLGWRVETEVPEVLRPASLEYILEKQKTLSGRPGLVL